MRHSLPTLWVVAGLGTAIAQPALIDPFAKISAIVRGIDAVARTGETDLALREADPLRIDTPASLLTGSCCYARDVLAHPAPYDPVFKVGAPVCEDRRTVVPR